VKGNIKYKLEARPLPHAARVDDDIVFLDGVQRLVHAAVREIHPRGLALASGLQPQSPHRRPGPFLEEVDVPVLLDPLPSGRDGAGRRGRGSSRGHGRQYSRLPVRTRLRLGRRGGPRNVAVRTGGCGSGNGSVGHSGSCLPVRRVERSCDGHERRCSRVRDVGRASRGLAGEQQSGRRRGS